MKPLLIEIPVPIETNRLLIRPPVAGDGAEINAATIESFDALHEWMPWAKEKPSLEDSEEFARRSQAEWILRQNLCLLLFDRQTGSFVGGSGLHRIDWELPRFEIGYWVRNRFSGKGYITESTAAIAHFAFSALNAKRVEIRCDADNTRSSAIPQRLGFELEATLKAEGMKVDGTGPCNTQVFARLRPTGLPDFGVKWGVVEKALDNGVGPPTVTLAATPLRQTSSSQKK